VAPSNRNEYHGSKGLLIRAYDLSTSMPSVVPIVYNMWNPRRLIIPWALHGEVGIFSKPI
jgi:hypothetical protein